MAETLRVENFLTIKSAFFEFKKINVLVGEQATGKSLIAKLAFFFKQDCTSILLGSPDVRFDKKAIHNLCRDRFELLFPKYTWKHTIFKIVYSFQDYKIEISNLQNANGRLYLKLNISDSLLDIRRTLTKNYQANFVELNGGGSNPNQYLGASWKLDYLYQFLNDLTDFNQMRGAMFIPSSRSFFVTLNKNVFTLLSEDIGIDEYIKQFGSLYETTKSILSLSKYSSVKKKGNEKVDRLFEEIISGQYEEIDGEDWIVNKDLKVKLVNASSGQQEAFPMLFILSYWPFNSSNNETSEMLFIEEPEAHLFPNAQNKVVRILSIIFRTHPIFITTHSPYLLTAINNLMTAHDTYARVEGNQEKANRVLEIIDQDEHIRFEDVAAYTLVDGELKSILNQENRLIGENILDSVSDELGEKYDKLLDFMFED